MTAATTSQRRDSKQQRKRNHDVVGDALGEAERAGRQLEHKFEEPRAGERREAEREYRKGRGGGRLGENPVDPVLLHLCFIAACLRAQIPAGDAAIGSSIRELICKY